MSKDQRHRNAQWTCGEGPSLSWDGAQLAVLMDVRDELKILNRLLGCHNFVTIPTVLRSIRDNTKRRRRRNK